MGFIRLHIKRANQRTKNWFGLLAPAAFYLTLPGIIILVIIVVQRPAIGKLTAGLTHREQVSPFACGQITFIQNAIDQRYFSFKLSESQKSVSETYRLGSMDMIFGLRLSEKGRWKICPVFSSYGRLLFSMPIYILGHALLN